MAENSKIEWTTHTFNPWRGCTKVSAGCANCYAETLSHRNPKALGVWGDNGTRVVASDAMWREPVKWNRLAGEAGERHRVFCASLADVFEDRPELVAWRQGLFELIDTTPNLDWLLLTKRPENILQMWPKSGTGKHVGVTSEGFITRANVWIGTSVEDQAAADKRISELLKIPAAVRFLSMEPLLGPVDISYPALLFPRGPQMCCSGRECACQGLPCDPPPWLYPKGEGIDWVIVGGESGHGARPCEVDWIRGIVRQCKAASVPCFVKQLGSKFSDDRMGIAGRDLHGEFVDPLVSRRLRDKKGGDIAEFPDDLRVREFPRV